MSFWEYNPRIFSHNRTVLPPVSVPRSQYYDEYSSKHHRIDQPPPGVYALRYPEPDYSSHAQQQREQQLHQQQQQQQHSESVYRSQRQSETRAAEAAAGVYRPQAYYDEDYVGASTFGRSAAGAAAASTGGAGHRNYQSHHESYARQSGGGGGGRSYSQHYSNGYGYGGNAAHHKSHVNTSKGGLFSSKNKNAANAKHRDISLPVQKRPRTYHKIHCCCLSFYWPPWAYEPCEPPTPIFYDRKAFARGGQPPSQLLTPQISPRHGGGGGPPPPSQRFVATPEPPPSTINQQPPPSLQQPPPPSLLHPNQAGVMSPPAVHY